MIPRRIQIGAGAMIGAGSKLRYAQIATRTPAISGFVLKATGSGIGVSTLKLTTRITQEITLTGTARFYTDAAGTLGESTTYSLVPGALKTIYLKVPSGTANLLVPNMADITSLGANYTTGWTSSTNAASITCDLGQLINTTVIRFSGNHTFTGDVSALTALEWLEGTSTNTVTGSITNLTKLKTVKNFQNLTGDLTALTDLSYLAPAAPYNITGSITNLASLATIQLTSTTTGITNLTGSIANKTLLTYCDLRGANTITGSIAGCTALLYFSIAGNNTVTYPNTTNIKGLSYLTVSTTARLTAANINQLLADTWLNRNEAKANSNRVLNLFGEFSSDAPTGQGLIDKAALEAYRSPNGDVSKSLWTVTTRVANAAFYFGDSITAGGTTSVPSLRWTTRYSVLDSLIETNNGNGGTCLMKDYTTPEGFSMEERVGEIPRKSNYMKYLFFAYGANDCVEFTGETARFYSTYLQIIDAAIAKGWSVNSIKILTTFRPGYTDPWNVQINAVGTAKGVQVIDTATPLYNGGNYAQYLADTVHPNDAGHLVMAQTVDANIIDFTQTPAELLDGNSIIFDSTNYASKTKNATNLVSSWTDSLGSGIALTETTDTRKPKDEGESGLHFNFDSIDDRLATAALTINQPCEQYFVIRDNVDSGGRFSDGIPGNKCLIGRNNGALAAYAGTAWSAGSPDQEKRSWSIVRVLFNGENSELQVNKCKKITGSWGTSALGGLTLGNRGDGIASGENASYKHWIIRKVLDNDTIRAKVYDHLWTKYAMKEVVFLGDSTMAASYGQVSVASQMSYSNSFVDNSVGSSTIAAQKALLLNTASDKTNAVLIMVGLNNLMQTAESLITEYQDLVNTARGIIGSNGKIIIATMIPCHFNLSVQYITLNNAIRGNGPTPITGVNGVVDTTATALNAGDGTLAAIYGIGDGLHENDLGRIIVAALFDAQLTANGII